MNSRELPIWEIAPQIVETIRAGTRRIIIHAPTGSGKSTQVPQLLADQVSPPGQIVILEPRRIAARMLAARVASERGDTPGREVGYQIRFDDCSSPSTRIKFVTEAILFRRLLSDPELCGISVVIFDEFHERHLYTDLTLGRIMALQATRRPDLLIIIMSATLDADNLRKYADPCVVLHAEGRQWPIAISYLERPVDPRRHALWDLATAETADLLAHAPSTGDVLIFMPGSYEIHRTLKALAAHPATRGCALRPLHGELPPAEQDRALEPADRRRIIVATNVAETSLTIDGVCMVVDSGLARIARFEQGRGINSLLIERISRAAADQRAGRAGRTAPGRCRRLWTEREHSDRLAREDPEIKRIDLSEALLLLKATGVDDLQTFRWLDPPDPQAVERAKQLLTDLGAIASSGGAITPLGRRMVSFPIHPRYARMLIAAGDYGCVRDMALIAALTQERNLLLRRPGSNATEHRERHLGDESKSDFFLLMRAWQEARDHDYELAFCERLGIHANAARQAGRAYNYFLRLAENAGLNTRTETANDDAVQRCILLGFADHVARCIDQGAMRYAIVHSRTGILARESMVRGQPLIVVAEVSEIGHHLKDTTVQLNLATVIDEEWLVKLFPGDLHTEETALLDDQTRRVILRRQRMFHDLVLERKNGGDAPVDAAAAILAEAIIRGEVTLKYWDHHVEQLLARLRLVRRYCPELNVSEFDSTSRLLFLTDLCQGKFGIKEVKELPVLPFLRTWLGNEAMRLIDRHAPERITLVNDRAARITYAADAAPFIAMRIQELFGVRDLPAIAMGRCPLLLHILAPSQRPVQVTQDLAGFWRDHYPRIKRELQRKYPKHEWR